MKIPVIIDCDTGVDDALALVLALGSDRLDIKAITTTFGNKTLRETTENTLRVTEYLGREDIPVAAGADHPLLRFYKEHKAVSGIPSLHGDHGIGNVDLPECKSQRLSSLNAVDLMAKTLRESTEPVTLVPIGPLTNLAVLLHTSPELKPKICQIAMMGGSAYNGNATAVSEGNISSDPEAAAIVFRSGVPIMMAGLDVTRAAYVTKEERAEFRRLGGFAGDFAADVLIPYAHIHEELNGYPGCALHDGVPLLWLMYPDSVKVHPAFVEVDIWGEYTRGCTNTDFGGSISGRKCNAQVAMEIDRKRYAEEITKSAERLAGQKKD